MRLFDVMDTAFNNFDETVRQYLSKTLGTLGLNYTHSQVFGLIFDAIKGVFQNALFYIEDAFTEQNAFTAVRKNSVYSLAKLSGYEPTYGYAATGIVKGVNAVSNNVNEAIKSKIFISNYTQITNTNTGYYYTIILPSDSYVINLNQHLSTHEFKVVEGTFNTATYAANGYSLESFSISVGGLFDKDYVTLRVNGELWDQVSNLYEMTTGSKNYILTVGYDGGFEVSFGNGVYGQVPAAGSSITVNYIVHNGNNGNITSAAAADLQFVSTGTDGAGNTINLNNYITLSCETAISGGSNADTIKNVRNMIGYTSRSLVLASEDNFKLFLNRFSFIGYCNIWSQKNSMEISICALSNEFTNSNNLDSYFSMNLNNITLSDYQKEMITTTLDNSNKTFAGVSINFVDPIIRQYAIMCYIKVDDNYNRELVKSSIYNALGNYFINISTNTKFIAKSDLIQTVLAADSSIEAFDLNIISKQAEQAFYNGYYYKNELKYYNGEYEYTNVKYYYETGKYPGLDDYGNIELNSNLEIPVLRGGFNYYPEKEDNVKNNSMTMETIQYIFI